MIHMRSWGQSCLPGLYSRGLHETFARERFTPSSDLLISSYGGEYRTRFRGFQSWICTEWVSFLVCCSINPFWQLLKCDICIFSQFRRPKRPYKPFERIHAKAERKRWRGKSSNLQTPLGTFVGKYFRFNTIFNFAMHPRVLLWSYYKPRLYSHGGILWLRENVHRLNSGITVWSIYCSGPTKATVLLDTQSILSFTYTTVNYECSSDSDCNNAGLALQHGETSHHWSSDTMSHRK